MAHDMDANDIRTHVDAVAFIDTWLEENAWAVDSRVIDFALDLRLLLESGAAVDRSDEELVDTSA